MSAMNMNEMAKKRENETKYHMLRAQLDKIHIIQPMDYNSLDVIEALLNEILSLRQKNKTITSIIDELEEKNEQQALTLVAYKHQNNDLFKQTGELHHEIISLLEKNNFQGKDIELKRLTDDTSALKYILNASKEKTLQYQIELSNVKQKYLELIIGIYEKKVNLSKIFEEISESDQLILKSRGIEVKSSMNDGSEVNSKQQNSSSNHTNSHSHHNVNNTNNKYSINISNNNANNIRGGDNHIMMGNRTGRSSQEIIEKIYRLETELKDKNNEILLLKKRVSNENALDQKVVIDYLKNELKETKEKNECYFKFQFDNNDKNNSSTRTNTNYKNKNTSRDNNYIYTSPRVQSKKKSSAVTDRKESLKMHNIQKENNALKGKYDLITKENKILKDDIKLLLEKYEEERHIYKEPMSHNANYYTNTNTNTNTINNSNSNDVDSNKNRPRYMATDINLISTLHEKVKESNSSLSSSQQNFKNNISNYAKQNQELERKIEKLNQHIAVKENLCAEQKEKINDLNKRIMQLTSNETIPSTSS